MEIMAENSPIYLERLTWSERLFSVFIFPGVLQKPTEPVVGMSHLAVVRSEIPTT